MKNTLILLLISITVFGCSSTNSLTLDVLEPAPVSLPNDIETVGIVGRTKSSASNSTLNKLDQVLSAELLKIDSTASRKAITGLYDELSRNASFTKVKSLKNIELENSVISSFSPVLSKAEVEKLCIDYDLDALFVLEFFDTDTKVDYSVVPVTVKVLGMDVNAVETMASVTTLINGGWRIYNETGDILYDEFAYYESVNSTGRGINPMNALAAVAGQKDAVENSSYYIGENYGKSLLPFYINVSRLYYVRGTDNFKTAKRKARLGDWNGAANLWEIETKNSDNKIAGRAYYNMAIINEINGDLETAIDWANKAYADYGNKKALRYSNILQNRKIRNDELKRQQGL
jgi:hypothetical protein